jgi:hypothetical protein
MHSHACSQAWFEILKAERSPEMGYFMWSEWDVPRQMEAKLATESLYISSIVLLPSPSPSSITVSVFFV